MDLMTFFSSTGLFLKSKVIESSHKAKICFFNLWAFLLKMYIFEVVTFFPCLLVIQTLNFSVVVYVYKIRVFDEAFLLVTIRVPMIN